MDLSLIVTYVLAVIGAATAVIAALNAAIVPLRDYARTTESKSDDALIERLAAFLAVASEIVLLVGKMVAPLALRRPSKAFPPAPALRGPEGQPW